MNIFCRSSGVLILVLLASACAKDRSAQSGATIVAMDNEDQTDMGSQPDAGEDVSTPEPSVPDVTEPEPDSADCELEVCDGVDNNCVGGVDEGLTGVVYADADGDGKGDPDTFSSGCTSGTTGYVDNDDDCFVVSAKGLVLA